MNWQITSVFLSNFSLIDSVNCFEVDNMHGPAGQAVLVSSLTKKLCIDHLFWGVFRSSVIQNSLQFVFFKCTCNAILNCFSYILV